MTSVHLAALTLRPGVGDWVDPLREVLQQRRLSVDLEVKRLQAWDPTACRPLTGGGAFVDGWQFSPMWLGSQESALALLARRIYLKVDGSVDRRPEREILDSNEKPRSPFSNRLTSLLGFLEGIPQWCPRHFGPKVELSDCNDEVLRGVQLIGARCAFSSATKLRTVHTRCKFLSVPSAFEVVICCDELVDPADATDLEAHATAGFRDRGAAVTIRHFAIEDLDRRLTALDEGDKPRRFDVPVWFLLRSSSELPSAKLARTLHRMDRHGLPWRRAFATDNRQWSVPDQLGSVLHAAGGHSHSVVLDGNVALPWSIGIDVSHQKDMSRAAAVLISPSGRLEGAWVHHQPAGREDLSASVLRRLVCAAAESILPTQRATGFLVIRDGRLFERENADSYRRDLGGPVTLVELRKHGNPPLLTGQDSKPPDRPCIAWVGVGAEESVGFMVTLSRASHGDFDSVLKVRMVREWDGLALGRDRLARILAAMTMTPGLGLHARKLPAPIYWADGIAGASDTDLRFRGYPVVALS